ncbi:MAG: ribA/ribD-fused uncharacterized protein [Alphaproteobacteria bacterium]|jgi:ribA/ribD-fused uncharacterized protein
MNIRNKKQLEEHLQNGNKVEYVFFWGPLPEISGVSKSCFSQWHPSPFTVGGITYKTAEHFMMAEKARLFGDTESAEKIVAAKGASKAKKIGREIKHFDESLWLQHRFDIVVNTSKHKFGQNEDLKAFLLSTGDKVLVEASPEDNIWGIGLAEDNSDCETPDTWQGLNLLGFALMEARDLLLK